MTIRAAVGLNREDYVLRHEVAVSQFSLSFIEGILDLIYVVKSLMMFFKDTIYKNSSKLLDNITTVYCARSNVIMFISTLLCVFHNKYNKTFS